MEISKLDGELEILVDYREEPTITLRGEVDFRNMERVKEAICGLVERGKASISVDLKELIFMDSTGVSALVDAARSVMPRGGEVRLVSPSMQLVKILAKSGFSKVFKYDATTTLSDVHRSAVGTLERDTVEFHVPSRPEMISHIRSRVADFAEMMSFIPEDIEDIKLAVGEASANALRHGSNPDWRMVGVKVRRLDDGISICIRDMGKGFNPDSVCAPEAGVLAEGGRGIMFMRALMDEVNFRFHNPGTEVELIKRFRTAAG